MLRRTADRAFGRGDEPKLEVPPAELESRRGSALDHLFSELHRFLERELAARRIQAEADAGEGAGWSLSRPRSLPQGVEFRLAGPAASFRFLNGMRGLIFVSCAPRTAADPPAKEDSRPYEVLSLHPRWGFHQPIRKRLGAEGWPRRPEGCRSPFHFTSVPALAARYLAAAGSRGQRD